MPLQETMLPAGRLESSEAKSVNASSSGKQLVEDWL